MARRRGLGSSVETHTRDGSRAAQVAIAQSGDTVRAIKRGKCVLAFEYLNEAINSFGAAVAHAEAADTNVSREAARNVFTARTAFKRACVR